MRLITCLLFAILLFYPWPAYSRDILLKPSPKSLEKFYPPVNTQFEYSEHMKRMNTLYRGVIVSVEDKDFKGAQKYAEEFLKAYEDISELVPEWKDYFKKNLAKKFTDSVKLRNVREIMENGKEMYSSCRKCHDENRISVWMRYYWLSKDDLVIFDKSTGQEMGHDKYMKGLSKSLESVQIYYDKGRNRKAVTALDAFAARYLDLKPLCQKCHNKSEVVDIYFNESINKAIGRLGKTLKSADADKDIFRKNISILRKEVCKFCHITHISIRLNRNMEQSEQKVLLLEKPPESLGKFYNPLNMINEYNDNMIRLGTLFKGIVLSLEEGDTEYAKNFSEMLLVVFKKTAKMVPEWEKYWDIKTAEQFDKAIKSRDQKRITEAVREFGITCDDCHRRYKLPVWFRFHWASYDNIEVVDPETEKKIEHAIFMKNHSTTIESLIIYFDKGLFEKAGKKLRLLKHEMGELRSSCSQCHINNDLINKIYFSENIKNALNDMKENLKSQEPDKKLFKGNIDLLRKEVCKYCHLTHNSARIIKKMWKTN